MECNGRMDKPINGWTGYVATSVIALVCMKKKLIPNLEIKS